jgi:triosephosphate isomerase
MALPDQAEEAHHFIREMIERRFSKETARTTRIVYGGSVKQNTVTTIFKGKGVDGVAVGPYSLEVENFFRIVRSCAEIVQNREGSIPPQNNRSKPRENHESD